MVPDVIAQSSYEPQEPPRYQRPAYPQGSPSPEVPSQYPPQPGSIPQYGPSQGSFYPPVDNYPQAQQPPANASGGYANGYPPASPGQQPGYGNPPAGYSGYQNTPPPATGGYASVPPGPAAPYGTPNPLPPANVQPIGQVAPAGYVPPPTQSPQGLMPSETAAPGAFSQPVPVTISDLDDDPDFDPDAHKNFLERMPSPSDWYKSAKVLVGLGPDRPLAESLYAQAEDLHKQQRYAEAEDLFSKAASRWPDSALEEDALFMKAECQFFQDKYSKASDTYVNLLKKHNNSRHLDTVTRRMFSIGTYWIEKQQTDPIPGMVPNFTDRTRPYFNTDAHALAVYESIRMNDPTGPLADDSVMATANKHFKHARFDDADYHYSLLRREYPQSEHQWQAHVLGLRSKMSAYQGARYDKQPLEEAGELIEQTLVQFPSQPEDERERLLRARQTVMAQRAERYWAMGQYYEKTKHYRAARLYYKQLLDETPNTPQVALARERLEQIADLPDVPSSRFQWLIDLFPKAED